MTTKARKPKYKPAPITVSAHPVVVSHDARVKSPRNLPRVLAPEGYARRAKRRWRRWTAEDGEFNRAIKTAYPALVNRLQPAKERPLLVDTGLDERARREVEGWAREDRARRRKRGR